MILLLLFLVCHGEAALNIKELSTDLQNKLMESKNYLQFCHRGCNYFSLTYDEECQPMVDKMRSEASDKMFSVNYETFTKIMDMEHFCTAADTHFRKEDITNNLKHLPLSIWCILECPRQSVTERTEGFCSKVHNMFNITHVVGKQHPGWVRAEDLSQCPTEIKKHFRFNGMKNDQLIKEWCSLKCRSGICKEKFEIIRQKFYTGPVLSWYDQDGFSYTLSWPEICDQQIQDGLLLEPTPTSKWIEKRPEYLHWCQQKCNHYPKDKTTQQECWNLLEKLRSIYPTSTDPNEHASFAIMLLGRASCQLVLFQEKIKNAFPSFHVTWCMTKCGDVDKFIKRPPACTEMKKKLMEEVEGSSLPLLELTLFYHFTCPVK